MGVSLMSNELEQRITQLEMKSGGYVLEKTVGNLQSIPLWHRYRIYTRYS